MADYALGNTSGELQRLERQASFLADLTRDVLVQAGLRPGMRVLDVGCGAGDVSLVASSIVGASGSILGVDRDEASLDRARMRLRAAGAENVGFERMDLGSSLPEGPFDAVVGRLVLMYAPDPVAFLKRLADVVAPGGILAFHEVDLTSARTVPPLASVDDNMDRIRSAFSRSGANPSMALSLDRSFRQAGLVPEMIAGTRVDGHGDGVCPAWVAGIARSLLPAMEMFGIATAADVDPDTLEHRIRTEALAAGTLLVGPLMIGAWARVPAKG